MNKSILVSALLAVALSGCSQQGNIDPMGKEDHTFRVQLLNDTGGVIREWIAAGDIRQYSAADGGTFQEKSSGKYFRVSGNVVVEEL